MVNVRSRKPDTLSRVQRSKRRTKPPDDTGHTNAPNVQPTYPQSLLGSPLLNARGNEPVRVALMQQMQQTHSNRAMQRAIQRTASGGLSGQASRSVQLKPNSSPALPVQRDRRQRAIDSVTAAATLTDAERAALPTLPAELRVNIERYEVVSARLKELKIIRTPSPDETKEQADLIIEEKELAPKIVSAKAAISKGQMDADFTKARTTSQDWFRDFNPDATFLGLTIRASTGGKSAGAHKELADRLTAAQTTLEQALGCTGRACAAKLGVYDISGLRQPQSAIGGSRPSLHCYGLAVDINYKGNPYVGNANQTAVKVIERATLLMTGTAVKVTAPPGGKTTGQMWDLHHGASDALIAYLKLPDDPTKLTERVTALQQQGDARDVAAWTKQIKDDYAVVWSARGGGKGDFKGHKDPAQSGYMDLDKRLVEALSGAGLTWGGEHPDEKDMMHFDWRGGTIQRALRKDWDSLAPVSRQAGWKNAAAKGAKSNQSGVTAPSGGWNAGEAKIGGVRRIPIEGLKLGNQTDDSAAEAIIEPGPRDPETKKIVHPQVGQVSKESAVGRAIALLPEPLDTSKPVQVLLHLHGYGVGYRQRTRTKEDGMETGTVRDVEIDRLEQQLEASNKSGNRRMIAILPQGAYKSQFGKFNSDNYLDEVFKKLWPDKAPSIDSVVMSGHSGAGETFRKMIKGEDGNQMPTKYRTAGVASFDAINGKGEYDALKGWVLGQLNNDLANLKSRSPDKQLEYLKTSPIFRGYHTANKGYTYYYGELDKELTKWFNDNASDLSKLDPNAFKQLRGNYKVASVAAGHEAILGKSQTKFGGKGALEDALGALPQ